MFRFETLYYAKNNKMHLSVHLRKDKPFFLPSSYTLLSKRF